MTNEVKKCIALIFPEDAQDRTPRILKRLRNDNDKDHHCAGSLTYLGRCAVDHAAADLIESLSAQLEQTENKLSELLYYVTGGRYSKTDYSTDDMRRFVDDYNQSTCNECDKCDELDQVTRERDALIDELKGECDVCANRKDCTAPKCRKSQHKECEECPCRTCIIDTNWKWEGVEVE